MRFTFCLSDAMDHFMWICPRYIWLKEKVLRDEEEVVSEANQFIIMVLSFVLLTNEHSDMIVIQPMNDSKNIQRNHSISQSTTITTGCIKTAKCKVIKYFGFLDR